MKNLLRILTMFFVVLMVSMSFSGVAQAASVPSISIHSSCNGMKITEKKVGELKFNVSKKYDNEVYLVLIYQGNSTNEENLIGEASDSLAGYASEVLVTITIDTAALEMKPGTYTVEYLLAYGVNDEVKFTESKTSKLYVVECSHNYGSGTVTRQLALMVYRYAVYKEYDTSERDDLMSLVHQENTSNWAREGVEWAVGAGLISGVDKNGVKDLQPQGNASRAQMAAILQRFCSWVENQPEKEVEVTPTL